MTFRLFSRVWPLEKLLGKLPRAIFSVLLLLASSTGLAGPKVVILTATYGAGHDAAANQVRERVLAEQPDAEVVIKNCQEFMPDAARGPSVRGFDYLQGHQPRVYDAAFNAYMGIGTIVPNAGLLPTGRGLRHGVMLSWIEAQNPDVILVTWYGAIEALDTLRRRGHLRDIRVGWVHTDNVSNGGRRMAAFEIIAMAADMVFAPGPAVEQDFVSAGVPRERVILTGMPIRIAPRPPLTLESVRTRQAEARGRLGLPDRTTLMIEGGSNGVGNYPLMLASILSAMPTQELNLIAATGRNATQLQEVQWLINGTTDPAQVRVLTQRLRPLIGSGPGRMTREQVQALIRSGFPRDRVEVRAIGFTPLTDYRLAANLVSTKPGGLSTAEMAAEGIPMLIRGGPQTASGQELFNVRRFREAGLAEVNLNDLDTGQQMRDLLPNQDFFNRFYAASETFRQNSRPGLITDWVLREGNAHAARVAASATASGTTVEVNGPTSPQGAWRVYCTLVESLASLRRTFASVRPH